MDRIFSEHLKKIRTSVLKKHTAASIAKWILENTTYATQAFSYKNHEYQERILSDVSQEVDVRKCSQVGVSEASARMSLALVNVLSPYTVAYTLPTAKFSGTFAKTRIDPIILGSKVMKENIHPTNDSTEIKQFGDSFLYLKGAASSNAPISIPCDHLVHDEVDFCDQEVLSQYTSRLTHSAWKRVTRFSTPTLPNFGIDRSFQASRRHFLFCKCHHCGHQFVPDYYSHVRIPGYTRDLREINKAALTRIRWQEAVVLCPGCGQVPSLQVEFREWVCENPSEGYVGAGYQVSPFDAPNIIKPMDLIKASTSYERVQDFVNFGLGLPMEDSEATLTREDFNGVFVQAEAMSAVQYVMGVDVGNVYHFIVGAVDAWGAIVEVHREQVPMGQARARYHELRQKYRVTCTVMDSMPHSETVMALQSVDVNMYAAIYMRSKSLLTHNVVERVQDDEEGKDFVRQVNINRNRALDAYMEFIRAGRLRCQVAEDDETFIAHHMSMKRVKGFDNESAEMTYSWQKTDGIDHYHHTSLYCWIASKIKGVSKNLSSLPVHVMTKFPLRPQ